SILRADSTKFTRNDDSLTLGCGTSQAPSGRHDLVRLGATTYVTVCLHTGFWPFPCVIRLAVFVNSSFHAQTGHAHKVLARFFVNSWICSAVLSWIENSL